MNWLKKFLYRISGADAEIMELTMEVINHRDNVASKKQIPIPCVVDWTEIDQKTIKHYINSEQGRKFIESCRHKLFSEHLDACSLKGNAEYHNAKMKGANDILFYMIYLATPDSISGNASPANEAITASDLRESETLNHRE